MVVCNSSGLAAKLIGVCILASGITSCVTLGNLLNLSGLGFPTCGMGIIIVAIRKICNEA